MILGKCNIYDYLIIWLLVVQFCLQSCSWLNRTPASRRLILLIVHGMITDRIGLHSVLLLLQIHLSVNHIKKTTKVTYSTGYPLTVTLISYVLPMLMGAQIKWTWQKSFRQDSWFNWLASGDIKVSCSFTHYSQKIRKIFAYHGNFRLFS